MSVVANPMSTMPSPEATTPAENASARAGEERRQSRPSTILSDPTQRENARPIR